MKPRDQQLDRLLDKALAEYGNAEPRFGLENRVVVSLEAESARIAGGRRWWWVLGTVSATAAVAAVVWMGDRPADSQAKFQPADEAVRPQSAARAMATEGGSRRGTSVSSANRRTRFKESRQAIRPHAGEQLAKALPKLEQFPSPLPLSEQEQILARYVLEYHEHAVLVARAQTELRNRERQEELETQPKESQPVMSDQ